MIGFGAGRSAKVRLPAGKSTTVKLTLNRAGKKLLAKHRTLRTKLSVTTKNGSKTHTREAATVTFKAIKKQKGLTVRLAGPSVAAPGECGAREIYCRGYLALSLREAHDVRGGLCANRRQSR